MAGRWRAQADADAAKAAKEAAAAGRPPPAPGQVIVFKLPRSGACGHCLDLHLTGGVPRLYTLAHAEANGTNAGRRADDWRFVVGSVHPHCGCSLVRAPGVFTMPKGWTSGQPAPTVIGPGGRLAAATPTPDADVIGDEP
jgi:hypothetical protein